MKRPQGIFMSYSGRQATKVTELFQNMIKQLGSKCDIKVMTPQIEDLLESVRLYKNECENPVPDALLKRTIRERMFKAHASLAETNE